MASPPHWSESPGGQRDQSSPSSPTPHNSHPHISRITSNTSSSSSVHPTVFSEASRSRSNTPSSNVSSGRLDDDDAGKDTSSDQDGLRPQTRNKTTAPSSSSDQTQPSVLSSPEESFSPSLSFSPRSHHATKSGHRPSQELDPIPQGEDIELPERRCVPNNSPNVALESQWRTDQHDREHPDPFSHQSRVQTGHSLTAPSRTESWWTHPRRWPTQSVYFVRTNMTSKIIYGVITLIVALFAAASAAYFAYKTYIVNLWQSEHDFFDWCRQSMVSITCVKVFRL